MLKGQSIICISSIDWDFIWQGHQEIMSTFAKEGNRVLFIENTGIRPPRFSDLPRIKKRIINWFKSVKGFRKERDNLYLYSPLFLPFPYSRIARWFNKHLLLSHLKRWLEVMEFNDPIIWTFLPTGIALDIISNINKKALIYYYIADFDQLTKNNKKLKRSEEVLMRQSDIIFVQGEYFRDRCLKFNDNVFIFPFGVNRRVFDDFKNKNKGNNVVPEDIKDISRPIIGYVGGVHRHINFELIRYIAKEFPNASVVLVGPIQRDISRVKDLPNVYFLGKKDFEQLPLYINQFDVCIVPYVLSDYTNTVYPTKINEYHMIGKPVVSTVLPEVIKSDIGNLVRIGRDYREFSRMIKEALEEVKEGLLSLRIAAALRNSWTNRIEEMSSKIEKIIEHKKRFPIKWQAKFLEIYRSSRRKIVKFTCGVALLWLLVFYTPLIWFLAEPLRFSQKPERSDAIVVFAGGVGESGRSGQGYEDRVEHAVELYRNGFAENIIFSSGAKYTFSEPYVMKALAVSLGIPEDAIILEDEAANTYQNVKFTNRILEEKQWDEIILVSSPYHMRRASLVFQKIAPEKKVTYAPAESLFYSRKKSEEIKGIRRFEQINLRQIKGIIHEYLAIAYYIWKGYI